MPIDMSSALKAYDQITSQAKLPGMAARDQVAGPDFGQMVQEATENVVGTLKESELQTARAVAGAASIDDVLIAVSNAEMTLQTVVSIRDRVIQAYNDVLRMQI